MLIWCTGQISPYGTIWFNSQLMKDLMLGPYYSVKKLNT